MGRRIRRAKARRLRQVLDHEMLPRKGRDNAIFRTERLAITEAGRVQIEAQLSSFQAGGYEELEIITEPGACPHCLPHDGEIVKVQDARVGENVPMFHPFCRCSTAAHMSREALEREFEAYGFARMSEQEIEDAWQKEQKRRADLKEEQLDRIIRLDATQHDRFERYTNTLKELAVSPERFSKLQRFGGEEWETLKYQYRTLNRYEIPDGVSASTVLALDEVAWKSK